jgi:hypothetical protein
MFRYDPDFVIVRDEHEIAREVASEAWLSGNMLWLRSTESRLVEVAIHDVMGRSVWTSQRAVAISSESRAFDVGYVGPGLYYVTLAEPSGNVSTIKLLVL